MQINNGFILHGMASDRSNGLTLTYYVRSNEELAKIEITGERIPFFIDQDANFNPTHFKFERKKAPLKNFQHQNVDIIYLNKLSDIKLAKDYLSQNNLKSYEIDIPIIERFLMERFIFGQVEFKGAKQVLNDGYNLYQNPDIRSFNQKKAIDLKLCSFDIETGVDGSLYSIAYHLRYKQKEITKVFMLSDQAEVNDDLIEYFSSEKQLIQAFIKNFHKTDPDVLLGWHVIGFDLMFLEKKCRDLNITLNLGRDQKAIKLEERKLVGFFATIPGRIVLDGPPTLRSTFYQFKNFKLETVAQSVLKSTKDIADQGKVEEIERRFKEDKKALARYNLLDCTLVLDIFEKLNIIDQLTKRVMISGLLMDRLAVSTAAFDFVFLPKLHRKGYIAPNRLDFDRDDQSPGGLVIEPQVGLHQNVAIFDFKSLYPSIMKTFNIDPYSLIMSDTNTIKTPQGFEFSKTEHILPEIITELFKERELAKQNNDHALSQAIKILMNSFYGILGSTRCRFYHASLASAITTTGHYILKESINYLNELDIEVIYGDTDSLFAKIKNDLIPSKIEHITTKIDSHLRTHLKDHFGVDSQLVCEYEKLYDQIYFSQARSGQGGAKKRYAGISKGELEFKGMEFVRSDWTDLAKSFQYKLYEMFFQHVDLEEFIKNFIKDLEMGLFDEQLIYTKRLSKAPEEYTKNIPPHVKAALLINHTGPYRLKEVSYYVTTDGPYPIDLPKKKLDYKHYIERQLAPIADDVLKYYGKSFDSFIVGDQLSLI